MAEKKSMQSTVSLSFGEKLLKGDLSLKLDKEYNKEYYNKTAEKTLFDFTESAFLQLMPPRSQFRYDLQASDGTCVVHQAGISVDIEEDISFALSEEESLEYLPVGSVSTKWLSGGKGCTVLCTDKTVRVKPPSSTDLTEEQVLGVLRCNYKTTCDRLKLDYVLQGEKPTDNVKVVVVADYSPSYAGGGLNDKIISCDVEFTDIGVRDVELIIKNIGTDKVVEGTEVTITGTGQNEDFEATEFTDAEGKVLFKNLKIDDEYKMSIIHVDYIDSAEDYLKNDSFVVPKLVKES